MSAGNFLALTDDDVMVDSKWFDTFLNLRKEHPDAEAFCGRMLPEDNSPEADYLNLVLDTVPKWIDNNANPIHPGFNGANNFIRRKALIREGMYNELFGPGGLFKSNNDGELAYRLIRSGVKIFYAPELVVYHSSWRGTKNNNLLRSNYAFGLGAFAGYYSRGGDLSLTAHILFKLLLKFRRLLLGLIMADNDRITDGYIHLHGILSGFIKGFFTPGNKKAAS